MKKKKEIAPESVACNNQSNLVSIPKGERPARKLFNAACGILSQTPSPLTDLPPS